jgi:hypothetical protein
MVEIYCHHCQDATAKIGKIGKSPLEILVKWSRWRDSNSRPAHYESQNGPHGYKDFSGKVAKLPPCCHYAQKNNPVTSTK